MSTEISSPRTNHVRLLSITLVCGALIAGVVIALDVGRPILFGSVQALQMIIAIASSLVLPAACVALWVIAIRLGRIVRIMESRQRRED